MVGGSLCFWLTLIFAGATALIQGTPLIAGGNIKSECRTKQHAMNAKPKVQSRDHQANMHASLGTEVLCMRSLSADRLSSKDTLNKKMNTRWYMSFQDYARTLCEGYAFTAMAEKMKFPVGIGSNNCRPPMKNKHCPRTRKKKNARNQSQLGISFFPPVALFFFFRAILIGKWPENQILIPDWTYFDCHDATLAVGTLSTNDILLSPVAHDEAIFGKFSHKGNGLPEPSHTTESHSRMAAVGAGLPSAACAYASALP